MAAATEIIPPLEAEKMIPIPITTPEKRIRVLLLNLCSPDSTRESLTLKLVLWPGITFLLFLSASAAEYETARRRPISNSPAR